MKVLLQSVKEQIECVQQWRPLEYFGCLRFGDSGTQGGHGMG
jgi:hypothetical protein